MWSTISRLQSFYAKVKKVSVHVFRCFFRPDALFDILFSRKKLKKDIYMSKVTISDVTTNELWNETLFVFAVVRTIDLNWAYIFFRRLMSTWIHIYFFIYIIYWSLLNYLTKFICVVLFVCRVCLCGITSLRHIEGDSYQWKYSILSRCYS